MPELHKNQIQWQAPEPTKASFDKPDYSPMADALGYISQLSDDLAKREQAYLDNQLAKSLEEANVRAGDNFEKADSLNANYEEVANKAIKDWHDQFNSFDAATKERFLDKNPYAAEEFELSVRAKANKKRTEQIYNRSKLDIAQWSTEIVNAGMGIADDKEREKIHAAMIKDKEIAIQNLGLPIGMTDDLLFRLHSEDDEYSIAYAIANAHFDEAERLLKEGLPTKGASARASYWIQLQNAITQDAREKAEAQAAVESAKADGKDTDSLLIQQLHQDMLAHNDLEAADKLRSDYYAGKDIMIPNEDGSIRMIVHSSDINPVGRDKLYNSMLQAANRAPNKEEYRAQYRADFNRLASGLMKTDGSLDLDEDAYVSPEQYALAFSLRRGNTGWQMLERDEQVFVDNVLRAFGTDTGLDMIDLNPRTQMRGTAALGANYQKANPVVNYQALLNFYSTPGNTIVAALSDDNQLTGREADTVRHFADPYKEAKFKGKYKIEKGTRPDALINLFALISTENNPYGMRDVGLGNMPRKWFESNMVMYINQIEKDGRYNQEATYTDLVSDFKNIYEMMTGLKYVAPKDGPDPLQKYATLAYYGSVGDESPDNPERIKYRNKLPRDDTWFARNTQPDLGYWTETEFNESLYKTGEGHQLDMDRQRAKQLEGDEVSTYKPREPYIKKPEAKKDKGTEQRKKPSGLVFRTALLGIPQTIGD